MYGQQATLGPAMPARDAGLTPKETSIQNLSQNVLEGVQYNLAQLLTILDRLEGTNAKDPSNGEARPTMPIQGNLSITMSQLEVTHQVIAKLSQKLFN